MFGKIHHAASRHGRYIHYILTASAMALIELRDLCKTYDLGEVQVLALKGVSLDVKEGEFVALIGPSGSGKSTLMNTLGCLDRPTSGSYRLAGEEVAGLNPDQLAQIRNQRIGFIFQNFNLLSRTTALENVEVPLLYNPSCPRRERKRRAKELLQRVGLGNRVHHRPNQLSGGQQQRVAIARALINRPPILLCDEPTGNLDTRTSREIMAFVRELNEREGLTVILVTHDLDIARRARRALVLIDGEVVVDTSDFDLAAEMLHQRALADDPQASSALTE
jgi:ABC-type lipoprotein export system ATPase subunit